mmetsp:Transcript_75571/g.175207  ORF Transcript_75571/g.175207 Transcript_75571/m.175207 type:complete len:138 (+) Transcript_75571:3-416(+)
MGVVLLQELPQRTAPEEADGDAVPEDVDGDDLDVEFAGCDKPRGGWSRQSTEEGFEEPSGEFSRQSTDESNWGLEEQSQTQQPDPDAAQEPRLGEVFGSDGLAYVVRNSFLHFNDQEAPFPTLRRVLSTGSCTVRGS